MRFGLGLHLGALLSLREELEWMYHKNDRFRSFLWYSHGERYDRRVKPKG